MSRLNLRPARLSRIASSLLLTLGGLLALSACSDGDNEEAASAQQTPPPMEVVAAKAQSVAAWHTYTTRLESPQRVQLRPRVSGEVEEVLFTEGSQVTAGTPLVRLDKRPFEAEVKRLEAEVARGQALLTNARSESGRAASLVKRNLISREEADSRSSNAAGLSAQLKAAQAQLARARLDLDYALIRAPIDGRLSDARITRGNIVEAGQSILTTLVETRQLDAYVDISELTWNRDFADVAAGDHLPVELQLAGQDDFPFRGELDFIDNSVDIDTGTLRVGATFNADSPALRPGAFARLRIASPEIHEAVLIPERAIGTDLDREFVLVVGEDNTLTYRGITTGPRFGPLRAVIGGLAAGDRVLASGPAKAGPGMPITPKLVEMQDDGELKALAERISRLKMSETNKISQSNDQDAAPLAEADRQAAGGRT
ncbi:efflux RND transporter periplasmic adaptor subunit [Cobetia crustatorum]|uniref:Efflux RND transporter periplasmic adaptor subunit n=2 Tax=Cobetia crustatorum TaxID=553385 RepID=A0A558HF90_9GAMM|nr:efflux RND transporter periplasmic adaptor subunit [Cobetia crustatorum]TVU67799.1 efflux RND transporter periplasmic adaptor subunit [Cobetia crustatorum]